MGDKLHLDYLYAMTVAEYAQPIQNCGIAGVLHS
ncbi:MAG: hypothetical protein CM1200mP40_22600 [Gammaproteobacteria bacterium]|nr:MAG: hypothetical protein CM1200mP40_22600 [Gammaproteobacteria bacterium]